MSIALWALWTVVGGYVLYAVAWNLIALACGGCNVG